MLSLRRLKLEDYDIKEIAHILHESNGIILENNSFESFKYNFNKYSLVLNDFKDKIKAVSACSNPIFEHEVSIISTLEDTLQIPIDSYFINARNQSVIKSLTEFYFDDINDGSLELNLVTSPYSGPVIIMEWILLSNLNGGVNISIDMDTINPIWLETAEIFDSIYPYINSFCYKEYIQVIK